MIRRLMDDYHIVYKERGNRHCREGWVQINCPFCIGGIPDFHMGYNLEREVGFNCYRCGFHSVAKTLSHLLGISGKEAYTLYRRYVGKGMAIEPEIKPARRICKLPAMVDIETGDMAYNYLRTRFRQFSENWLKHTIRMYRLKKTSWKSPIMPNRIIIPSILDGKIVNYQGRDYTGSVNLRYLNSNQDDEVVNIKEMVWGSDMAIYDKIMVCEGAFDAMTIGPGAVHLGGIGYTKKQLEILGTYKEVMICFDAERQAQSRARELMASLGLRCKVQNILLDTGDINEADKETIDKLKEMLQ